MGTLNLSLSDELIAELKRRVPARRRSAFVEIAIRERMELMRQVDAVRGGAGAWSNAGRKDATEEIRAQREAWATREGSGPGSEAAP
jgi:predicted transcriptional regulator